MSTEQTITSSTSLAVLAPPPPEKSAVEVAASASAALAKATIEAKFVIALQRPRSVLGARAAILEACKRPRFAAGALYRKPVGQRTIEGLSIRFAEEAVKAWRNVDVSAVTAWEDDERRLVRITVADLESNVSYCDEVILNKTVERSSPKEGQEVLATRTNSQGRKVYILRATEDDLFVKVNAAKSKAIRNSGLRLIPGDIIEEATETIKETIAKGGTDPQAEAKRIADAFAGIGIIPSEIEAYLGCALNAVSPRQLAELRAIFSAIRDGEASWSDFRPKAQGPTSAEPQQPTAQAAPSAEASAETDEDEIPDMVPLPKAPAAPKLKATKAPAKPVATIQQQLAEAVLGAGFTFDDFRLWGLDSGNVPDADSIPSFDDLPDAMCTRLLRAKGGLLTQLAELRGRKGGAE
jgi:hypothetical protein